AAGDDRLVGRAQVLARAVDDGPHALLDRVVLSVHAVDAAEGLALLDIAIDAPVIGSVADLTEARQLLASLVGRLACSPFALGKWLTIPPIGPVPDHLILVVHWHPKVPTDLRLPVPKSIGALRCSDLGPGHDEVVQTSVVALVAERAKRHIPVA